MNSICIIENKITKEIWNALDKNTAERLPGKGG